MRLNSFKYRISLLSLLLSGAVLLVFGLFFLSVISQIGFMRMDRELRMLADDQIRRKYYPPDHWKRFDGSLGIYGEDGRVPYAIRVVSVNGRDIYVSRNWLSALTPDKLPVITGIVPPERGAQPEQPEPPPRERLPGGGPGPDDRRGPPAAPQPAGGPRPLPGDPPRHEAPPRQLITGPVYATVEVGRAGWRVVGMGNEDVNLYIMLDMSTFRSEVAGFRNSLLVALPVALLMLALGGWLMAQRALRPVNLIAATAAGITTRGLDRRIPKADADREFAGLIDVINSMLDRLERSFKQAVRFSGDAAHELKTPLTILQGQLEQALQEAPPGSALQQKYSGLLEEVRRLATITKRLLLLAQADSGGMRLSLAPFDFSAALDAMSEDVALLAPDLKLEASIPAGVRVMADCDMMKQVLQNLVTNAIKYNSRNGWIRLELEVEGGWVKLTVANSGEEIPAADREKVFERFYRVSKSRNREVDGAGLGLSLAREIVLAHGGELVLESSGGGVTVFVLRLPAQLPGANMEPGGNRG